MEPYLHDFTLEELIVRWESREAVLAFKGFKTAVTIRCIGLRNFHVPYHEPWGPSVSVYEVIDLDSREKADRPVVVRMQSGDQIEILADEFEIDEIEREVSG